MGLLAFVSYPVFSTMYIYMLFCVYYTTFMTLYIQHCFYNPTTLYLIPCVYLVLTNLYCLHGYL